MKTVASYLLVFVGIGSVVLGALVSRGSPHADVCAVPGQPRVVEATGTPALSISPLLAGRSAGASF